MPKANILLQVHTIVSVPLSESAPPPPLRKRVCPPHGTKGGEGITRMRGGGSKFGRLERNPCILNNLCLHLCCDYRSQNTYCTQCPSPLRNWDPPSPLQQASLSLLPEPKGEGGGHNRLRLRGRAYSMLPYICTYFKNAQSISYFSSIYRFIQMSRVIGK